ncbi:hypothetical protein ScPMuIL_006928 [Solemya velum]
MFRSVEYPQSVGAVAAPEMIAVSLTGVNIGLLDSTPPMSRYGLEEASKLVKSIRMVVVFLIGHLMAAFTPTQCRQDYYECRAQEQKEGSPLMCKAEKNRCFYKYCNGKHPSKGREYSRTIYRQRLFCYRRYDIPPSHYSIH